MGSPGWGDRLGPACCFFPWFSLGSCTFIGILVPAAWGEGEGGKFGHTLCAPDEFREKDQVGSKAEAVLPAEGFREIRWWWQSGEPAPLAEETVCVRPRFLLAGSFQDFIGKQVGLPGRLGIPTSSLRIIQQLHSEERDRCLSGVFISR